MLKRKVRKVQKKRTISRRKSDEKGDLQAQKKRTQRFYRLVSGDIGIFEAVDEDCPQDDPRRKKKPSGAWLDKSENNFGDAISFWTEGGLRRYAKSRLLEWHASVVAEKITVIIIKKPSKVLYEDKFQIVVDPESIGKQRKQVLGAFLSEKGIII